MFICSDLKTNNTSVRCSMSNLQVNDSTNDARYTNKSLKQSQISNFIPPIGKHMSYSVPTSAINQTHGHLKKQMILQSMKGSMNKKDTPRIS